MAISRMGFQIVRRGKPILPTSPPEASLQAFAPHRYPTTPGFCMHSKVGVGTE
jgi:hypothetical protein